MGYISTQPHFHHYHTASAQVSRQPAYAPQSFYRHQLGSSTLKGSRSRMTRIRAIESGAHPAQLGAGIVGGRGLTIRLGGGWLLMESLSITTRQLRSSNGGWGRTHGHMGIVGGGRDRRELGLLGACCSLLHGLVARPVGDHHAADGEDGEDGDGEEEEPISHRRRLAKWSTACTRVGEAYQRRTAKAMIAFTMSKIEPPPSSATISAKLASQKTEVTK